MKIKKKYFLLFITFIVINIIAYQYLKQYFYSRTFHPELQTNEEFSDVKRTSYSLSSGENINILFQNKNTKDVILYFHGNTGRLSYIINSLQDYSFVSPTYPGYHFSSGEPSADNVYLVAKEIKSFITKQFGNDIRLHVLGHSLGSQPAIYFMSLYDNSIESTSIVAGFDSVYGVCKDGIPSFTQFVCLINKYTSFDSIKTVKNKEFHSKYYQFHKLDDKVISYHRGVAIYNEVSNINKEFKELYQGSHSQFPIKKVLQRALNN
jgi:pimeloyl-ACP methyl ester carboxylesterase